MQKLLLVARILDLIITISMHIVAIRFFFFEGEVIIGSIIFAAASLYQIPTILNNKYDK